MKSKIYFGSKSLERPISRLFLSKAEAIQHLGEDGVATYLDDESVVIDTLMMRKIPQGQHVVLDFLFPRLKLLDAELVAKVQRALCEQQFFVFYAKVEFENVMTTELFSHVSDLPLKDKSKVGKAFLENFVDVNTILIWFSLFESRSIERSALRPDKLHDSERDIDYVTAGWQAGMSSTLAHQRAYWNQFIQFYRKEFGENGVKCAIEVNYIEQLGGVAGVIGFGLALIDNNQGE